MSEPFIERRAEDISAAELIVGGKRLHLSLRPLEVGDPDSFRQMGDAWSRKPKKSESKLLGAAVGYLGYEAGSWFERMPPARDPSPMPPCWFGEVVAVAERPWPTPDAAPRGPACSPGGGEAYEAGVRTILGHIRAGDCYQVNLARALETVPSVPAHTVWERLLLANPARRGMWLRTPHGEIVSNSPELLLSVRGRRLRSVPIKGTAALDTDPRRLLRSAKERAELTMIVDLVRADLARVARPGSIRAGPRRVGRVGHVWHAMQAVEAELDEGRTGIDALAALFPAGSVTGAPKVRAMEIIAALEPVPRGVYCGSMGILLPGGDARWNVAIRTITFASGSARMHVGAGLVIGSDPRREWAELLLKARKLAEACA
jgi:anthranilate/para-aminobenzoate synthase component I